MNRKEDLNEYIRDYLDRIEDVEYEDSSELATDIYNALEDDERLEEFDIVYNEQEAIDYIRDIVVEYQDECGDIYEKADKWDGNGYTNPLDEDEWEEVFHNVPDTYKEALRTREAFVVDSFGWASIPDLVWDVLEEDVDEQLGFINYDPMSVIDNVIINGSYGDFDDFKNEDETDEEFVLRKEDNCFRIYPDERFIICSL